MLSVSCEIDLYLFKPNIYPVSWEDLVVLYLKALVYMLFCSEKENPGDDFKQRMASTVQTERYTIVFYLGMKELVSEKFGRVRLDNIIK